MDILRLENKTDTKEYIKTSNNALLAHKALGDYEKVNAMARELLPLSIRIMGKQSQLVGQIYFNLAVAEQAQGRMEVAARYFAEAADISIKHFKENFYILSEKEKLTWWDNQAFTFSLLPSLLMQAGITEGAFVESLANQQLQLKGFVLDDAATSLRKARSNATPGMKALLDEWQSAKTLLGKTLALPLRERSLSTDSLEQVANTLEKKISQGSATISTMKVVKWQDVQAALKPKEAAIEFVRFPFSRNGKYSDTIAYGAIIIRKDMTSPRFVVLGSEKQFSGYLASDSSGNREVNIHRLYRSNIRKKEPTVFPGDSLYAAIWHPLTRYLEGVNTVSVAPDGILHKVAFHALPVSKDKMLLDLVQLKQYSGIRQLAEATGKNDVKWNSAYLVGNVDFNTTKTNGGGSGGRKSGSWAPLPATMDEVSNIRQIFKSKGVKATVVTGSAATEDDFKKLGDRPVDIIHLATHGFFLRLDNTVTGSEVVLRGEQSLSKAENPLLRSGIILAGANKSWSGEAIPAGAEDGIVNAYEISQVDLSATKLVVLSACETALGDVQGTEGVFGLQRAFKMAGVKNIIVSLWQVPDKETSQLMTLFYTELVKGRTVRDAFHAAQQQMRKKHPPFYWAAFVLVE
jgi:CHAT domain-containing protein